MQNIWAITDTVDLIGISENIKTPASYLVNTFFPNKMPVSTTQWVATEYRKAGRVLAPYVVPGSKGINLNRMGSEVFTYKPPLIAGKRTISLNDIELRQFGETPIFSTMTPAERAAQMQANDLVDIFRTIDNRQNAMASEILQTGQVTIKGYADDGRTAKEDVIKFKWNGLITPTTTWDNANATIYDDIKAVSDKIQEESGIIPTLMICGANVEKYLLTNKEIYDWLLVPNRQNLAIGEFAPHYTSPQARRIGTISSLNLEVVSYLETYYDEETGKTKPFITPDTVIIGNPGRGKQLYGAITYMDNAGTFQTAAAEKVPVYTYSTDAQVSSLTVYSRNLLVPEDIADWMTLKVKGD